MIEYCIDNYETASTDFKDYRNYIKSEKDGFKQDVIKIFGGEKI